MLNVGKFLKYTKSKNGYFLIEVQLTYNIILISVVQHNDSIFL